MDSIPNIRRHSDVNVYSFTDETFFNQKKFVMVSFVEYDWTFFFERERGMSGENVHAPIIERQ